MVIVSVMDIVQRLLSNLLFIHTRLRISLGTCCYLKTTNQLTVFDGKHDQLEYSGIFNSPQIVTIY